MDGEGVVGAEGSVPDSSDVRTKVSRSGQFLLNASLAMLKCSTVFCRCSCNLMSLTRTQPGKFSHCQEEINM